jgi:quinoprotein glucose dehydrogenase
MGTIDGYLLALDAATGKPVAEFGRGGRADLIGDWLAGADRNLYWVLTHRRRRCCDVRGFDVRTGKLIWTFRSIPAAGKFGNDRGTMIPGIARAE